MRRKVDLLGCALALVAGPACWGQFVQNSDLSVYVQGVSGRSQAISGVPGGSVSSDAGWGVGYGYGYQILRKAAASLWAEFVIGLSGGITSVPGLGSVDTNMYTYTPGLRLMIPLQSRVSAFVAAGGGAGEFYRNELSRSGTVTNSATWHGVFDAAAGVDVRLSRFASVRAEIRDYVSGRGLSGVDGRNHPVLRVGISLHH